MNAKATIKDDFGSADEKTTNQYAVKIIQGTIQDPYSDDDKNPQPLGHGLYFTSVNIHNPWRRKITYSYKLAVSLRNGTAGTIANWKGNGLNADQATQFDWKGFKDLLGGIPDFLEGFFVIECRDELDVVGVYTGESLEDKRLGAMHMERVPARKVPAGVTKH